MESEFGAQRHLQVQVRSGQAQSQDVKIMTRLGVDS